ncbi:MAG: hypothetical protein AB7W16_24195 [Candidatus Obscuribacterales bacterium]
MAVDPQALALAQQQEMFFRDPLQNPIVPGVNGTLFLLRRDLNDLPVGAALWPRVMAMFAGIDLLAKFYDNSDATQHGEIGRRFRRFVARFITQDNTQDSANNYAVWHCRNSVLHSFGWYSQGGGHTYRFSLTQSPDTWIVHQSAANPENWLFNIQHFETRFHASIGEYEALIDDPAEPVQFPSGNNIFERYGWMFIG